MCGWLEMELGLVLLSSVEWPKSIFVVTETHIGGDRARDITDRLPFDGAIHTETIGRIGGLWLLWNSDRVEVSFLASSEQEIHSTVKVIVGDFNEPLIGADKFGGRVVSINRALLFKDCLDKCNMVDLGFSGPRFTWTNGREILDLIQERIDRFFVNPDWYLKFPEARVTHLTRCHSDHCLVLLEIMPHNRVQLDRPFKFQRYWLSDLSFPQIVAQAWGHPTPLHEAIKKFATDATAWNREHFGNIFAKKNRVKARLNGIQKIMATKPSSYIYLLELEKNSYPGVGSNP
nr:uncharacterized protein LOC112039281 [Quercus suber]